MKITAISPGKEGRSHFTTKDVMPITVIEGEVKLSAPLPCHSLMIHEFGDHFVNEWHNPPQPQYVIILEGKLRIELEDNSFRTFKVGDIFLAEDTTGRDHRTLGVKAGRCLVITLEG